jgi:photosystem II stability/assembly factor-like uncharacterized protein
MKRMRISASVLAVLVSAMVCVICSKAGIAHAAIETEVIKTLNLEEKPLDIANSPDGTKAYILGNKCIYVYRQDCCNR